MSNLQRAIYANMSFLLKGQRGGGEFFKESFMKTYLDLFCRYLALYTIPEKKDKEEKNLRVETIAAELADIDYKLLNLSLNDSENTISPDIRANMFNEFLRMQPDELLSYSIQDMKSDKSLSYSVADEKLPETYLNRSNFLIHKNIMTTKKGEVSYFNEKIQRILNVFEAECISTLSKDQCLTEIDKFVLYTDYKLDAQNETQPKIILFLLTLRMIIVYNKRILRYKMKEVLQKCSNAVINCYSKSTSPQKEEFSKLFFELASLYDKSYVSINEYQVEFIIPTTNKKRLIDFMVILASAGITVGLTSVGTCLTTPVGGVVAGAIATAACGALRNTVAHNVEKTRNEQLLHKKMQPYLEQFASKKSKKSEKCEIADVYGKCIQWINDYKNEAFENFDKYIYLYEILFAQYRKNFTYTDCGDIIDSKEPATEPATQIATEPATATVRRSSRIAANASKTKGGKRKTKKGGKRRTKGTRKTRQ